MDKKGSAVSGYTILWVIVVLFLIIPFFITLEIIVKKGIDVSINTHNLEHYLLLNRLFYSSNSFFYTDPYTGRTNFEAVDITKFNEDTLRGIFGDERRISFKITLGNDELYYNRNMYEVIEATHAGSTRYGMAAKNKIVTARDPEGREEKRLLIVNVGFCKNINCG